MKIFKILLFIFILVLGVFTFKLLSPTSYKVPQIEQRDNIKFWDLSTGSIIAYTKIEAKSLESSTPIIYLHGGPGGFINQTIIDAFSPLSELGHSIYFYDQIGSGHSARLDSIGQYSVHRHREDLSEIIDRIGVNKVILLGQSWGAMLAMEYASVKPNKIEKLIFTGPGPILPWDMSLHNIKAPDSLNLIQPKFTNREANQKLQSMRTQLVTKYAMLSENKLASDQEMDDFFAILNQGLSKSMDCNPTDDRPLNGGGGYYSQIMTVKSFHTGIKKRKIMPTLQIPILILKGQCDNIAWGYTKEYLDLLPIVEMKIIDGCGHDLISCKLEEILEEIRGFLVLGKHNITSLLL